MVIMVAVNTPMLAAVHTFSNIFNSDVHFFLKFIFYYE